jgi:hypothetical protein
MGVCGARICHVSCFLESLVSGEAASHHETWPGGIARLPSLINATWPSYYLFAICDGLMPNTRRIQWAI